MIKKINKIFKEQTPLFRQRIPSRRGGTYALKNGDVLKHFGFTLVEMLVVISIIGILSAVLAGGYVNSQKSSQDAARKLSLKTISDALNQYYADNNVYPPSIPLGGEFALNGIIYIKKTPKEAKAGMKEISYMVSSTGKSFWLFTNLENSEDKACNPNCGETGDAYVVSEGCCYVITSSNTTLSGMVPTP